MNADQTLRLWVTQERAVLRAVGSGAGWGPQRVEHVLGKPGLQVVREMREGVIPVPAHAHVNRYCIAQEQPGACDVLGILDADLLNPGGTVHGGWMATLLDSAMGSAVMTTLPPNWGYATASMPTEYLKPLRLGVVMVKASARISDPRTAAALVATRRPVVVASAEVVGPDGLVYATATGTYRVFRTAAAHPPLNEGEQQL